MATETRNVFAMRNVRAENVKELRKDFYTRGKDVIDTPITTQ